MKRYYLSLWLLCGMFGLVAAVGLFYRLPGRYQIKIQETEHERENYESQREQIHDLYRIGREANHMRHDMKIKLDVVHGLIRKGEYEEAEKCISRLGSEWGDYPELPQETGNEGLNVALLKAGQECRECGVRFHYVVMGNPQMKSHKTERMEHGFEYGINKIYSSPLGYRIGGCIPGLIMIY